MGTPPSKLPWTPACVEANSNVHATMVKFVFYISVFFALVAFSSGAMFSVPKKHQVVSASAAQMPGVRSLENLLMEPETVLPIQYILVYMCRNAAYKSEL